MNNFMRDMEKYRGVYALVLTPFKEEDLSIDMKALEAYTEWQVEQNPHMLFPVCGSSEMMDLSFDERLLVAKTVKAHAGDKPVFATANLCQGTFEKQIDEVKRMSDTGIDGLVFVTKGYGDDQNDMYNYMMSLAEHTELPIMIYEFPGFPNNKMTGETYGKLVQTGKFIGIKDTTCTMPLIEDKIAVQGETAVLQANISYLFKSYQAGARGVVATPSTCGAYMLRQMYDAFFVEKDEKKAEEIHQFINVFANTIDSGFTASAKYMVSLCGVPMAPINRRRSGIDEQKMNSIESLRDFALRLGLMK